MSLTLGMSPKIKAQIARLKKSDNDAAVKIRKLYARGLRASDLEKEAFQTTGRNVLVKGATATFKGFDNSIIRVDMQTENPMAEAKPKKKTAKPPTAKQLRARAKFVKMVKARAKAARAAKRAAGIKVKPKTRVAAPKRKRNIAGYISADGIFHPIRSGTTPSGRPAKKLYSPKKVGEKAAYSTKSAAKLKRGHKAALKGQRSLTAGTSLKQRAISNPRSAHKVSAIKKDLIYAVMNATGGGYSYSQLKTYSVTRLESLLGKVKAKKNPSTAKGKALFKEFSGRPARKVSEAYAPKGSGAKGTLGAMGKLVKIKVRGRTALDFRPTKAILARDAKNQMYVLGKGYKLNLKGKRHNPTGFEDLGAIESIEYEATKTHLDGVPTIYVHKMGEEGGAKPHLLVNDEGLAIISGGDYTITERGIEN